MAHEMSNNLTVRLSLTAKVTRVLTRKLPLMLSFQVKPTGEVLKLMKVLLTGQFQRYNKA